MNTATDKRVTGDQTGNVGLAQKGHDIDLQGEVNRLRQGKFVSFYSRTRAGQLSEEEAMAILIEFQRTWANRLRRFIRAILKG